MSVLKTTVQAIADELQRQLGDADNDELSLWIDDEGSQAAMATIGGYVDCTALAAAVIAAIRGDGVWSAFYHDGAGKTCLFRDELEARRFAADTGRDVEFVQVGGDE